MVGNGARRSENLGSQKPCETPWLCDLLVLRIKHPHADAVQQISQESFDQHSSMLFVRTITEQICFCSMRYQQSLSIGPERPNQVLESPMHPTHPSFAALAVGRRPHRRRAYGWLLAPYLIIRTNVCGSRSAVGDLVCMQCHDKQNFSCLSGRTRKVA